MALFKFSLLSQELLDDVFPVHPGGLDPWYWPPMLVVIDSLSICIYVQTIAVVTSTHVCKIWVFKSLHIAWLQTMSLLSLGQPFLDTSFLRDFKLTFMDCGHCQNL
uniref:Uncharacterized protein n=1 Tax=Arion vulgaris TaxID=1028688 RepID=A0A0B6XW73_9EUPU